MSFHDLRRAIDGFLMESLVESLGSVEYKRPEGGNAVSIADCSAADVQVSHILGTPEAEYIIVAYDDELRLKVQLNVYRLVVVYTIPLHQAQDSDALKPRFARWEIGAGHAGWNIGWRDTVAEDDRRSAEIYCYAMLPVDFLASPHHQLYWINDIVQMTRSLFLESRRMELRLS